MKLYMYMSVHNMHKPRSMVIGYIITTRDFNQVQTHVILGGAR